MKQLSYHLHHCADIDVFTIGEAPHDRIGLPALRWITDLAEVEGEPIALANDIACARVATLERLLGGSAHERVCDRHQPTAGIGRVERQCSYLAVARLVAPQHTRPRWRARARRDARR